jgi:Sec7-like guanine-nucleotide exchange factor
MYDSANLSKSVIGEYIAKRDELNMETLQEFVNLFSFEGVIFICVLKINQSMDFCADSGYQS